MSINIGYEEVYSCDTCSMEIELDKQTMREHLVNFHNATLECKVELMMHIAKKPRHVSIYRLTFDNAIVTKTIR